MAIFICLVLVATLTFTASFLFANLMSSTAAEGALGFAFGCAVLTIVIALLYSFRKISKMTNKLLDIFKNRNTMYLQLVFFIGGMITLFLAALFAGIYFLINKQDEPDSKID